MGDNHFIFSGLDRIPWNGQLLAKQPVQGISPTGGFPKETSMHGGNELLFGWQEMVDRDRANGTHNEITGRARRHAGEWTGDTDTQIESLAQEVKGKAQKSWSSVKAAIRAARDEVRSEQKETDSASR